MKIKKKVERAVEAVSGKFFVVNFSLVGVILYVVSDYRDIGWLGYVCILFFLPSFIFLYRLIYRGLDEGAVFTRIIFFVGQIGFLVLFATVLDYEKIWIGLIANYFLLFIFFQFLVSVFQLLIPAGKFISRILTKKGVGLKFLNTSWGKNLAVNGFRVVIILVVFGLGWRNWHLAGRVKKLETVIGESRLFCNERESVSRVKKSTVRIVGRDAQGSGFFFTGKSVPEGKYVLTNWHVVAKDDRPKVILDDYTVLQGKVIAADKGADLAVVKADVGDRQIEPLEFGDINNLEELDELVAIGFPLGTDIRGEATANKGHFVALRQDDTFSTKIVQTDIGLVPGMSGGPMIDICGNVYGVNLLNIYSLSMGVSTTDFVEWKWDEMLDAEDPLVDIEKIEFKPNSSPLECVRAFYNYQTTGEWENAYQLLAESYTTWTFDQWKEGYENTLYIIFVKAEQTEDDVNTIFVKFYSADLVDETLVYKYFEGTQRVDDFDGVYKLVESNIEEIEEPEWSWFWEWPEQGSGG